MMYTVYTIRKIYKTIPLKKIGRNFSRRLSFEIRPGMACDKVVPGFFVPTNATESLVGTTFTYVLRSMRCYSTKPPTVFRIEKEESWYFLFFFI